MPKENEKDKEELVEEVQEEPQDETQSEEQLEEVSASEEPTEEEVVEELPEDSKERTREQFEKLKKHNQELKRQLEQKQQLPSVLDMYQNGYAAPQVEQFMRQGQQLIQQPAPNYYQQPAPPPEPSLVDEQGYVNTEVLKKELEEAKLARKRAEDAERRAQEAQDRIARFEQDAETRKLYEQFPELDPANTDIFNEEAYHLVRNELTSQIVETGSRDAIAAATKMSKYFRKQQVNQAQQERRAVTAPTGRVASRPVDTDEYERLKRQSRNDPEAMFKRLEMNGY